MTKPIRHFTFNLQPVLLLFLLLLPVDIKINLKKIKVTESFYVVGGADVSMGRLTAGAKTTYSCNGYELAPGTGAACQANCESYASSCGGSYNNDCVFNSMPDFYTDVFYGTYTCP